MAERALEILTNLATLGDVICERFEETALRLELVVDGHARDIRVPRDRVHREVAIAVVAQQQLARTSNDASTGFFRGSFALPESIRTRH